MSTTQRATISGFTFIRNGVDFGFPFEASIRSLLPLVDEFVIAVGLGHDGTLERIRALNDPKIASSKRSGTSAWPSAVLSTPSRR